MADQDAGRPAVVIRTIEGRRRSERPAMSGSRYREQVAKLERSGVRVPSSAVRSSSRPS
jgi:hypothetical protein